MGAKIAKLLVGLALAAVVVRDCRPQEQKKPLSFEAASVRPAAEGSRPGGFDFMRSGGQAAPRGLLVMTAPVMLYLVFAYDIQQLSDVSGTLSRSPEWTRSRLFTVVARAGGEPSMDQLREMMRTLLADRFALKLHEEQKDGAVNRLTLVKPGVLGPQIKPHPVGESCVTQPLDQLGSAPNSAKPQPLSCGVSFYRLPGHRIHIGMVDASAGDLCRILGDAQRLAGFATGGLAARPTLDGTGLSGRYDLTLEFYTSTDFSENPDDTGGPTLTGALEQQLGMRLVRDTGSVRTIVIDQIAEPTPD